MKRKKKKKPLTEKQKQAAWLMFDGRRIGEIATQTGVHRTTIWRWYHRKDFQREIDRIHAKWIRDYRRERLKELRSSPEHKQRLSAARRRLQTLEKQLQEAGNSGDMAAYKKVSNAYDKCFNEAYLGGKTLSELFKSSHLSTNTKKKQKPLKYIIEIIR